MQRLLGKLISIVVVLCILTFVLGMLIPLVESQDPRANIDTLFDGVWYAVSTITSVGYGDHFPVTETGRFLGFFLILVGSTIFFVFTSLVAAALLLRETQEDHSKLTRKINELEAKIDLLTRKLSSGKKR